MISIAVKKRGGKKSGWIPALLAVAAFIVVLAALQSFANGGADTPAYAPSASEAPLTSAPLPSPSLVPFTKALDAYIVDVGQGDSIFLRSPSGKTMLVDTGESGSFDALDAFLKAQNVERLDVVVATHPHSDHMGGMAKLINAYSIGAFYLPDATNNTVTFEKMLDALEKHKVPVKRAEADGVSTIPWSDEVTVRILSPLKGVDYDDLNNISVVLRVSYGASAILLTGDVEIPAEKHMLEAYDSVELRATVLKSGHHGSSTSGGKAFLDAVSPKIAVISCASGNSYGHPHKETLEAYEARGIEVYRTDTGGTIHVRLTGTGAEAEAER